MTRFLLTATTNIFLWTLSLYSHTL